MQVRTGKTLTAMNTIKLYGAKNCLFVTKKKAISSIEDDYNAMFKDCFDIIIINFEQLHNYEGQPDIIVIDEAHSLGQFPIPSERTKLLKKICKGLPIIYLSGTPTPESFSQQYHQFWVSSFSPFEEETFYKWAKNGYIIPETKFFFNRQIPVYSNAIQSKIDAKTRHLFLSFSQEEAGFEQLVEEKVHYVEMTKKTYALAHIMRTKRVFIGKDKEEVLADTEVKLMQKLHQIYSGSVIPDSDHNTVVFDTSKIEYILNAFKGQKIGIYYKFKAELGMIMVHCNLIGLKTTDDPKEFNSTDSNTIFVSQIQSGREGVNLSSADCLVMYNIDFSAVSYWQVRARLQTKNRTKSAIVHWIFAKDGIETKIYKAVQNKQDYTLNYFKKDYGIK